MKVTRRNFIKIALIGGGAYLAGDFILHGPLYSYLEKFSRPQSMSTTTNVTPTTNITTSPSKEDEFKAFIEKYPVLAKGFDYQNYKSALKYFEAMPELKGEEDLHEFLNIHIRQWDFILYSPYISIPQIMKNGGLISSDDTSFDNLRIRDLKYHLELDEKGKSLLPLRKSELEEQFPNEYDREIINRSRTFHASFLVFNGKTGEYAAKVNINNWTVDDAKKALIDNLSLILDGDLYERITKIYEEKREDIAVDYFDMLEIANMIHCPPPWSYVYPKAGIEFREKYLPIIKEEKTLNLGMRYTCAIAHKDAIEALHGKHEHRTRLYILYTKALGYSGIEIFCDCREYGFPGDETVGAATPKNILERFPKGGRYGPGVMLSPYVYGYDVKGKKLKLLEFLPTGGFVEF
jgi:hypothetical protein